MKKSVLFLAASFYPQIGGVETHVYQLAQELVKKGWQVTVLTNAEKDQTVAGINIISLGAQDYENKKDVWKKILEKHLLFDQHRIVHVHDVGWWTLPLIFNIQKKLFISFHGWEGKYPVPFSSKLQRWMLAQLAQGSIHIGGFIQEFYWDKPDMVQYGGVKKFSPSPTPTLKKSHKKKPRIIFLGRLEQENFIQGYLQFFSALFSLGLEPEITWVGDGAYAEECKKLGRVTGMVTEVDQFIAQTDLVCANSYLSILESQAAAKIVCALYHHPLKQRYLETYPGAAAMLLSSDPKELATKAAAVLADEKKFSSLSVAAQNAAKEHTWQDVANDYIQLWETKHV